MAEEKIINQIGSYLRAEAVLKNKPRFATHYTPKGAYYDRSFLRVWFKIENGQRIECEQPSDAISLTDIKKAMLEYRRKNNFYEVGDLITSDSYGKDLLRVTKKDVTDMVQLSAFRHATDEEIKVGYRL